MYALRDAIQGLSDHLHRCFYWTAADHLMSLRCEDVIRVAIPPPPAGSPRSRQNRSPRQLLHIFPGVPR
jgi:hypothetical protein